MCFSVSDDDSDVLTVKENIVMQPATYLRRNLKICMKSTNPHLASVVDYGLMFVFLCLLSLALAEPPVRDSYLDAAESLQDHGPHQQYIPDLTVPSARHQTKPQHVPTSRLSQHGSNFRDNLSQLYGAPKNSRLSQEYGAPEFRDSLSQVYGPPSNSRLSQEYGAPDFRDNLSQHYGTPNQESFRSLSQEYGVPATSQYDATSFPSVPKSSVTHYGSPTTRNLPSSSYLPSQRSLSTEYGLPDDLSRRSSTRNSSPVQKYGVPKFQSRKSQFSDAYSSSNPVASARSSVHQSKVHSEFGTRSLPTQYGAPEARNLEPLEKFGVPKARGISQEYGQPARSIGTKTKAHVSSYSTINSPTQQYGVPESRNSMPSNQYGVPIDGVSDQGYQYARNALDLLNQEPANYEFAYKVDDYESGSDFGHVETRQEDKAEGSYFVVLPDGTKQVVEYEADEEGFKPRISVQPADVDSRNSGPY
ncbi:Pro-resilin [Papilio xuthus]|uniref:Pro-resilin n=1 Tax=Papilio xuthus TaxID=66420 RepID=A0A194Q6L3_PAPXU|nr:Pro-resilin [Papilio xuthus]